MTITDIRKADSVFSGISTFARLPYWPCLASDDEKYDIAFLGEQPCHRHIRLWTDWSSRCTLRHRNLLSSRSAIWPQWHKTRFSPSQSIVRLHPRAGADTLNTQRLTKSSIQWRLQCPSRRQPLQQLGNGPRLRRHPRHIVRTSPPSTCTFTVLNLTICQLRQRLRHPTNRTRPQRPVNALTHDLRLLTRPIARKENPPTHHNPRRRPHHNSSPPPLRQ